MVPDLGGPVACVCRVDQVGQPLLPWRVAQVFVMGLTLGRPKVAGVRLSVALIGTALPLLHLRVAEVGLVLPLAQESLTGVI
jgi:hypothetical protein